MSSFSLDFSDFLLYIRFVYHVAKLGKTIVLFVFKDFKYGKGGMDWRLGRITEVKGSQVSVTYSLRGAKAKVPPMHTVQTSARDVSIFY